MIGCILYSSWASTWAINVMEQNVQARLAGKLGQLTDDSLSVCTPAGQGTHVRASEKYTAASVGCS